jgi:hypothetical protein
MTIPMERVRGLETTKPPRPHTDPRGAAVQRGWQQPYQTLLSILRAPTLEEFFARAEGFEQAKEQFWSYLVRRQNPDEHGGHQYRDPDFEAAVLSLIKATTAALSHRRQEWNLPAGHPHPMEFLDILELVMKSVYSEKTS